jgi:hypothetical protein
VVVAAVGFGNVTVGAAPALPLTFTASDALPVVAHAALEVAGDATGDAAALEVDVVDAPPEQPASARASAAATAAGTRRRSGAEAFDGIGPS